MNKDIIVGTVFLIFAITIFIRLKNAEVPFWIFGTALCVTTSIVFFTDGVKTNETKWICCNQNNYYSYCSVCGKEKPIDLTKDWYCCDEKLDAKDNFCPKCGKERLSLLTAGNTTTKERNEENNND